MPDDTTAKKEVKKPKPLPAPNSDFYQLAETLPAEELAVVKQIRAFMETKVVPIITKYWVEDQFPFELLPAFKELNIGGVGMKGYGCRGGSALLFGLIAMEMSKYDASIATFFGVHNGLAMGSIYLAGSEEQRRTTSGIESRPPRAAEMSSGILVSTPGRPGGIRVESEA